MARELAADGVHLGRADATIAAARQRLGANAIIGASCYDSLAHAESAVAAGADYIAFGSFFPSRVKPDAPRAPLALLAAAKARWRVPVVAIGGITAANAAVLLAAGADAVAVISAVFDAPDVAAAAAAFARGVCRACRHGALPVSLPSGRDIMPDTSRAAPPPTRAQR